MCVLFRFIFIFIGNIAYKKHVSAGTVFPGYIPETAVDGDIDAHYKKCYRSRSRTTSSTASWTVDLGAPHVIYNITIYAVSAGWFLIVFWIKFDIYLYISLNV